MNAHKRYTLVVYMVNTREFPEPNEPSIMARSLELVIIVFLSSRFVKSVHLELHTGIFPYTQVVNWGMNF